MQALLLVEEEARHVVILGSVCTCRGHRPPRPHQQAVVSTGEVVGVLHEGFPLMVCPLRLDQEAEVARPCVVLGVMWVSVAEIVAKTFHPRLCCHQGWVVLRVASRQLYACR